MCVCGDDFFLQLHSFSLLLQGDTANLQQVVGRDRRLAEMLISGTVPITIVVVVMMVMAMMMVVVVVVVLIC